VRRRHKHFIAHSESSDCSVTERSQLRIGLMGGFWIGQVVSFQMERHLVSVTALLERASDRFHFSQKRVEGV
jgi:hypothetical protein